MLDVALKVLKKISDHGFSAYLVGGFVRDYILGIESNDIDICTNARPKELLEIFENAKIPKEDYGAVTLYYKDVRFEITTFRREIRYIDNRRPEEIEYIDSLELDILRRDFTINTLCMDQYGTIIDLLNGRKDIDDKVIRIVGDSNKKFSDDALRILRAVRFAAKLHFDLDDKVEAAILENKYLLRNISYERKREELDKIFTCSNAMYGIRLLIKLGLDIELEIPNLRKVHYTDSLIGIWAVLDVLSLYPFTSNERRLIMDVQEALLYDSLDPYHLYKNDLYVHSVAGEIKGISNEKITKLYSELPIHHRKDLNITTQEILQALGKEPGAYLKEVYECLEREVLYHRLENRKEVLIQYCIDNYS